MRNRKQTWGRKGRFITDDSLFDTEQNFDFQERNRELIHAFPIEEKAGLRSIRIMSKDLKKLLQQKSPPKK